MLSDLEHDTGVMAAPALRAIREEVWAVLIEIRPDLIAILRCYPFHPDEVDEIIQTVMLKALSFTRSVRALRGWLCRVTQNAAIDLLRVKQRERTRFVPCVDTDQLADGRDSIIELDESDERDALRAAIERLPGDLRLVMRNRLAERTVREIAQKTGLSRSTVRRRLDEATVLLRLILQPDQ